MASILDKLTDAEAMKFINQVADPFKSAPHLPKGITEIFVKISPWLLLLGLLGEVFIILGSLALLVISPIFSLISLVVSAATAFLLLQAFTPLKNREMKGWVYLFWLQVLGLVSSLASTLDGHYSSIVGAVIGLIIGMYLLFEMRPFYGTVQSTVKKVSDATK